MGIHNRPGKIPLPFKSHIFCAPSKPFQLVDYAPNIKVIMLNSDGETKEATIAELLPEAFTKNFLSDSK